MASNTAARFDPTRPKVLLFAFFTMMLGYVLVNNESFLVNAAHPIWNHYQPIKWWLLPHGLAGACALLLGPLQFSDRLRQKYTKLHRVAGRIYVVGALIASPLGVVVQYGFVKVGAPPATILISITHGGLWALTTLIALAMILQGKVQTHRQWMTRSFFIGPGVFLAARVALGLTKLQPEDPMFAAVIWLTIAAAIPLADVTLQAQEYLATRKTAKLRAAVA